MSLESDGQDLLSELLRPIRLTGVFHSWWDLRSPWSVEGDSEDQCAVLHYIAEGSCWISAQKSGSTELHEGDLALFPTGVAHRLSDRPDRKGVPLRTLLSAREPGSFGAIRYGGDDKRCRMLCAGLYYDASLASSLYRALPWMMVLDRSQVDAEPLLNEVVSLLAAQRSEGTPGTQLVTLREFEMAFVLALRPLLRELTNKPEILAALRNPEISRALLIMYNRYSEPWTTEALAREVGMSRSAFTASFRELVGEGPGRHLTSRRMHESARCLTESDIPLGVLHKKVGYKSSVGFHLAFRKLFGMTPGEYRQQFNSQFPPADVCSAE